MASEQMAAALGVDGICAGLGTGPSGIVLAWGQEKICIALEDLQFTLGQGQGPDAADDRLIAQVAADVVDRRLRFDVRDL